MTPKQIEEAAAWLAANKSQITRIRPRISGHVVRYIPRRGWGTGLDGVIDGSPGMWALLDAPDAMDGIFRQLGIPVDQPL